MASSCHTHTHTHTAAKLSAATASKAVPALRQGVLDCKTGLAGHRPAYVKHGVLGWNTAVMQVHNAMHVLLCALNQLTSGNADTPTMQTEVSSVQKL